MYVYMHTCIHVSDTYTYIYIYIYVTDSSALYCLINIPDKVFYAADSQIRGVIFF